MPDIKNEGRFWMKIVGFYVSDFSLVLGWRLLYTMIQRGDF